MKTEDMLKQRESRYGAFTGHALIAQKLKDAMQESPKWHNLTCCKKEALEMIQHKVARILNGDPEYDDNWKDIAGYATLVEQTLTSPLTGGKLEQYEQTNERTIGRRHDDDKNDIAGSIVKACTSRSELKKNYKPESHIGC